MGQCTSRIQAGPYLWKAPAYQELPHGAWIPIGGCSTPCRYGAEVWTSTRLICYSELPPQMSKTCKLEAIGFRVGLQCDIPT